MAFIRLMPLRLSAPPALFWRPQFQDRAKTVAIRVPFKQNMKFGSRPFLGTTRSRVSFTQKMKFSNRAFLRGIRKKKREEDSIAIKQVLFLNLRQHRKYFVFFYTGRLSYCCIVILSDCFKNYSCYFYKLNS